MQRMCLSFYAALLAAATLSADCEPDIDETEARELEEVDHDGELDELAAPSTPLFTYNGWTPWTSEEYPPVTCDPGSMVGQFGCSGGWCDNVRLDCFPTGQAAGGAYWTTYFSEEGNNIRECAGGYWMSGIACKGGWCDNVSLQCTYYPNITPKECLWTGWVSEEGGGTLTFPSGYYARGARCSGSRCDNKRFLICRY